MKTSEAEDGYEENTDDAHDDDGDNGGDSLELLSVLVVEDVDKTEDEDAGHVKGERDQEHEEITVVPSANAIIDPRTVMIEYLDTVVTDAAMRAPRGSIELAGDAPLHTNRDTVDLYIPVERGTEVIVSVFVRTRTRNYSWVHKCSHGEVDENKKCDNSLEDWHSIPVLLQNVPFYTREIEEQRSCAEK